MLAVAALLLTGSIQALISPPYNLVALHPVAWVPALWAMRGLSGRRALLAGWLVGISAELAIFYWLPGTMVRFGGLPTIAAAAVWLLFAVVTGFYAAVFAWGLPRIRRAAGSAWPAAAAAWFCALEFLNPQIFGYLQGHAWYQVPEIFLISAVTGVTGISFLVLWCNALLVQALEANLQRQALRAWGVQAAIFAACVVAAVLYSHHRQDLIARAEREVRPLTIAVIQPNHTIERRRELARASRDAFARDLLELSRRAAESAGRRIDVYVWPEGALRSNPERPENRAVLDFVAKTGAEVWTGGNHEDGRVEHNSAFRIHPPGRLDVRYDKNILVPFGEYVPLKEVVPGFRHIRTVGNFEAGRDVPVYDAGAARFVFTICYEAIKPPFVRRAVSGDVNLIVNVTVDSWYGDTSEQSQHLMLAAAQSAMLGIPMVRSTTTGISAVIDARGLLVQQAGKFTREALVVDVRPVRVTGAYAAAGDWLAWACVAASLVMLAATRGGPPPAQLSSSS